MQDLTEGMHTLAGQLDKLKKVPKSGKLCATIDEFPGIMEEVVNFIKEWLKSWSGAYSAVCNRVMT